MLNLAQRFKLRTVTRAKVASVILIASMLPQTGYAVQGREENFDLGTTGILVLPVPLAWQAESEERTGESPYAITIKPGKDNTSLVVMVTPVWSQDGDPDFNSVENVEDLVRRRGEEVLPTAVETSLTLHPLKGPDAEGFVFLLTDKAPGPGEYKYVVQGSVAVGKLLLGVTILSNDPNSADLRAALAMLKGARHIGEPDLEDKPSWKADQLQQHGSRLLNEYAAYSLTIPDGWALKESSNPGHVALVGPDDSYLSIQIKEEALDAKTEFRALEMTLPFTGGRYRSLGSTTMRLGKELAIEFLAERTNEEERRWERTVGAVHGNRFYILQADAPWARKKDLQSALKTLEKTFQFISP